MRTADITEGWPGRLAHGRMMIVAWGDGLEESTQGLDILGVRAIDQGLEATLVNGITTVSFRARYFTLLCWAIGEFFHQEAAANVAEFDDERLRAFLGRVEFVTLACTRLDAQSDTYGALGSVLFKDQMDALGRGESVPFPESRGGAMLGAYFGPCSALGLLRASDGAPPFLLTPRGKGLWEVRKEALNEGVWRSLLWSATMAEPQQLAALIPQFSLGQLSKMPAEASLLRDALLMPWSPSQPRGEKVAEAYERFNRTVAWLTAEAITARSQAPALLSDTWRRAASGTYSQHSIQLEWAEYEWRRRLHYALELMLSAVSDTVRALREATSSAVVNEWLVQPEVPSRVLEAFLLASRADEITSAVAFESVASDLYLDRPPPDELAQLKPHARALMAYALLAALTQQSRRLRSGGQIVDKRTTGERALAILEFDQDRPFAETLRSLAELCIGAHLATTFRKMGQGQKCSLRFFPEGGKLLTTDTATGAGRSGPRLANVIGVLAELAAPGGGDFR